MGKPTPEAIENFWRTYLTTGEFEKERRQRQLFRLLPGSPRCKNCYAPFQGTGSIIVKTFYGKEPSNLNPQLCNICEQFAQQYQGGAEVELSLLFADVRGSTTLAKSMNPTQYSQSDQPLLYSRHPGYGQLGCLNRQDHRRPGCRHVRSWFCRGGACAPGD